MKDLLCINNDDFLFSGDEDFVNLVINPIREAFVMESEYTGTFKYLLDLIETNGHKILLDQTSHINSINSGFQKGLLSGGRV